MLLGEFDPHRRSLRLELRRHVFLHVGVAPCKNHLCLAIWATTLSKHAPHKFSM